MNTIAIGKDKNLRNKRPVFLNGKEIGGFIVGADSLTGEKRVRFYVITECIASEPCPRYSANDWPFLTIKEMKERLPVMWQRHMAEESAQEQ